MRGTNDPKITAADCRACGACCIGGLDTGQGWADCNADDVKRMSPVVRDQLVPIRQRGMAWNDRTAATPTVMTEAFGGVCKFLRGTPGKRVSCRIYATRPNVCKSFQPGSRGCLDARRELELGGHL